VTTPAAKARIEGIIDSVEKEGGKILLDGRNKQVPNYPNGNFVGATLIEVTANLTAYKSVLAHTVAMQP
jgi:malonate-semialdehyde dehydrogenase (acetylating)/methylmalonate-semialdehyde dehydrogenase